MNENENSRKKNLTFDMLFQGKYIKIRVIQSLHLIMGEGGGVQDTRGVIAKFKPLSWTLALTVYIVTSSKPLSLQ